MPLSRAAVEAARRGRRGAGECKGNIQREWDALTWRVESGGIDRGTIVAGDRLSGVHGHCGDGRIREKMVPSAQMRR